MIFSASQQAAAVEAARRIVLGGTKAPRVGSSEAQLLAAQLAAAAECIREMEAIKNGTA